MLKKLKLKFVCITMAIVTLMLGTIFSVIYVSTRASLKDNSERLLQTAADEPGRMPPPGSKRIKLPQTVFSVNLDRNGEITAAEGGLYSPADPELTAEIVNAALLTGEPGGELAEYELRFCVRVTPEGKKLTFADISGEHAALAGLVKTCLLIGAAAFAAFLAISFLLAAWAVKPVEKAWNQQKQFVADASHELKTPLTVIMTNAELLNSPQCADDDRLRFSSGVLTMSHQMRSLVEGLLELARLDSGTVRSEPGKLNFSETVESAVLPFEPVFFENGLSLKCETEPGIALTGSEEQLKRVVDILLDNAQKYSSPGGETSVKLSRLPRGRCRLEVSNDGEPMSREELKNIFKRFYRADKVRKMNGSYGLGLSIAEATVERHGGRISAESKNGKNIFTVDLPAD